MEDSDKQFMAYWDSNAYAIEKEDEVQQKGIDFFTEENGYFEEDVENIQNMDTGDTLHFGFHHHIITRIK